MAVHRVRMSDGCNLHVKLLNGSDPSPSQTLLIALHSAPGISNHTETESAYGFLQDKFRVLVYDARGSGQSDLTGPYTHERWCEDVEELRKWANATKFILAGGSYGSFIALDYALKYGNKLLGLILRGAWAWGTCGQMQALKACIASPRANVDPERQYRLWSGTLRDDRDFVESIKEIEVLFGPPSHISGGPDSQPKREMEVSRAVLEEVAEESKGGKDEESGVEGVHVETHNFAFSHNMPRFDVRARLGEIKVKTLLLVGRYDIITPVEFSREIEEGINSTLQFREYAGEDEDEEFGNDGPRAETEVFERSGHNPAEDQTKAFQNALEDFCCGELKLEL